MTLLLLAVLAASHALASLPFWRKVRAGAMPGTADFATLSVILYYDLGIACRGLFPGIRSDYFAPLDEAPDGVVTLAVLILAAAPWILRAAAALARGGARRLRAGRDRGAAGPGDNRKLRGEGR